MTMPSWEMKLHVLDGFSGGFQHASLSGLRDEDTLQFYSLCFKEPRDENTLQFYSLCFKEPLPH